MNERSPMFDTEGVRDLILNELAFNAQNTLELFGNKLYEEGSGETRRAKYMYKMAHEETNGTEPDPAVKTTYVYIKLIPKLGEIEELKGGGVDGWKRGEDVGGVIEINDVNIGKKQNLEQDIYIIDSLTITARFHKFINVDMIRIDKDYDNMPMFNHVLSLFEGHACIEAVERDANDRRINPILRRM